ncbi:MAG: hypothetical protein GX609_00225, partial [Actinomycetales bacterium]|nr:hypothetical protein [Actinomycetales bacterium]
MASLAALACAAPSAAAPGWNPPLEGAERTSHVPEQPRVGLDSAGNAAMAWTRFDPDSGMRVLETRIVPAAGPSGPAVRLSAPGASAGAFDIAVAPDGRAVAVWEQDGQLVASVRPPGGAFGAGQTLSKPAAENAAAAVVELDADGDATVLWTTIQGSAWRVRTTTIDAGDVNGPTTLVHMEAAAQLNEPALAVDPTGRAHGVWVRAQAGGGDRTTTVQRAYRPAGGGFAYQGDLDSFVESPYNMESPAGLRAPSVAVDRDGRAVAAWMRSGFPSIIRWSAGPAGGTWTAAATLGGEATAGAPLLAMSGAGEALIAGTSAADTPRKLWVARRPAGGTFGAQETVADAAVHTPADLAVGAGGETVLTWLTLDGGDYRARGAYRSRPGAAWEETALGATAPTFYSGTLLPTAAVNAGGHAAVAWSAGAPDTFHTLLARYEVA